MGRLRNLFLVVAIGAAVLGVAAWWNSQDPAEEMAYPLEVALGEPTAPFSSEFRNTSLAEYVGGDRCVQCHADQATSFSTTPHANSLERIDVKEEPHDGQFLHTASGRRYRISREDGHLIHAEEVTDPKTGEAIVTTKRPLAWRIGSGHHSRSYLIDIEGYWFESPITWYSSQGAWGMSPGYETSEHDGFNRAVYQGCVVCHAGRVEAVAGGTHSLQLLEATISCESCHGPGSLHVSERTSWQPVRADFDDSIVNPAKLSRSLNEDVCARCHLRSEGWALVRGRDLDDFRPGLPLTDYRIDFKRAQPAREMEVVGHFEQMHASACYARTETLTCTTCHNPHESPDPEEKVAYYRRLCLDCHSAGQSQCGLSEVERTSRNPADDCTACHMPKSETDLPHFTFTHHRIGLHDQPKSSIAQVPISYELIAFGDVSRLDPFDLQRCRGLALQRAGKSASRDERRVIINRAVEELTAVFAHGMRDPNVQGGLAYLYWEMGRPECLEFAKAALADSRCDPETRTESLIVVGDMSLQLGMVDQALSAFTELTQVRMRYTDWQMLGVCRSLLKDHEGAIEAIRTALEMEPGSIDLHLLIAEEFKRAGQMELAAKHQDTAQQLRAAISEARASSAN